MGRKHVDFVHADFEKLNSLSWNPSTLEDVQIFPFVGGSEDLDGGFFSLEEIDESQYLLEIPNVENSEEKKDVSTFAKAGKRKYKEDGCFNSGVDDGNMQVLNGENTVSAKKRKTKKKRKEAGQGNNPAELEVVCSSGDDVLGDPVDRTAFNAWDGLRLHPLLMRSIYRLGFKEPTPIQKACIPVAAHQGKDVAGAAETGSGKTLAFGMPILQRLLEEREKNNDMAAGNCKDSETDGPKGLLRALIITPTRELALQVSDHIKEVAKETNIKVVPVVGGMSSQKQERLLRGKPDIVIGTPGRLWELMSEGEIHLTKLHYLSFFVLDEADRMIENGHFNELQSIIDMLPVTGDSVQIESSNTKDPPGLSSFQKKKRQTFVFSATIALSFDFRKKLKHRTVTLKEENGFSSIEALSARAGMRADAAIVDLTNESILANRLEESFIECGEDEKDAYLYYLLCIHGQGRTIVFCTSIAALRHISSLLRILEIHVWTLHAQMQQRARLKAMDRFRENENGILIATDVAARGLDIAGVRTVVHYQLPHSAEVYIHRSGRTARASSDGCSIALISPNDRLKFASLCKAFSKDDLHRFPLDCSYMPGILRRLSLAHEMDKMLSKDSQEKAKENWVERNARLADLVIENDESEDEKVQSSRRKKASSSHLQKLQQELRALISQPLQPKTFSRRCIAGAGVTTLLQQQFMELGQKGGKDSDRKRRLVVIGQDCREPLEALRNSGQQVRINVTEMTGKQKNVENMRKRKQEKKRLKDLRRKQKRKVQALQD